MARAMGVRASVGSAQGVRQFDLGNTVKNENPELSQKLALLGQRLNLKPHQARLF